jgi:hypothetical protein
VLTGLAPSDRVIESPPDSLATGDRVLIAGAAPGGKATQGSRE